MVDSSASSFALPLKVTPDWVRRQKSAGHRLAALTAYDYPMARILDEAEIPILLVGDSLGMVVLGYPDTTFVSVDEMCHHVRAVCRAKPRGLIVADLPFQSYTTPELGLANASRLLEAGAEAVKLEGGTGMAAQIERLSQAQIPVMGHLGMLPQSIRQEGAYRIKGKTDLERDRLEADLRLLQDLGVFSVVLELVEKETAGALTRLATIPTIGIGSGPQCDGQILVSSDLTGAFPWFRPKFVTAKADVGEAIRSAAIAFRIETEAG